MAARRLSERSDLRRRTGGRSERRRILVVTEGTKTEPSYLQGLCAYLRQTGVRVCGVYVRGEGRDPERVVKKAALETGDGRLVGGRDGFESVWCVFDVDEHRTLQTGIRAAARHGFHTVVSNPCFEIWLLWHYEDCRRSIDSTELRRRLRRYGIDKAVPKDFLFARTTVASGRAGNTTGVIPANPGTGMAALVHHIMGDAPARPR
ncbi:RloB family protein [Actinoalloteichus fjordicus]|uniref:RloB-like protein n=1 Tax=Actinoalloteichus fjordicus TaxID=1612552 RepID=A0AAC9LI82_9PSEU|nr:RloB family protein [Actinoalloteichus fjordicus]APU17355.1 RloB-like protein [Actinoalloteichus fjordicus]